MQQIREALQVLKSLWGALAAGTILFPGSAALLKLQLYVEHSQIGKLYTVLSTVVSVFVLLILVVFRDELGDRGRAKRMALCCFLAAIALMYVYVSVRHVYLNVTEVHRTVNEQLGEETVFARDKGIIRESKVNMMSQGTAKTMERSDEKEYGDPWDVVGLVLFVGTITLFTSAFTALGVHVYQTGSASNRLSRGKSPRDDITS